MKTFISIPEAKRLIASSLPAPRRESVPLAEALGCFLAEDVAAREDLPRFTNTSMDGFALRRADVAGASETDPRVLPLAGEVAAGDAPLGDVPAGDSLRGSAPQGDAPGGDSGAEGWPPGSCLRIFTGAPLPESADGVVPVEYTEPSADGAGIVFKADLALTGDNVRPAGEDLRAGDLLLPRGRRLDPSSLGLLAAQGLTELPVFRRPRAGFLATGNELVGPGEAPGPGQIRNSNATLVCAQLAAEGFPVRDLGVARDEASELRAALGAALDDSDCDVLVSSGGVSMGRYDLVGETLADLGADWVFHKIAQKPGKPLAFLTRGDKLVFGLPGNPVSSFMCTWYYILPALRRMAGDPAPEALHVRARLSAPVTAQPPRFFFARAWTEWRDGGFLSEPVGLQESHALGSLSRANSFILLPASAGKLPAGTEVDVAFFSAFQGAAKPGDLGA